MSRRGPRRRPRPPLVGAVLALATYGGALFASGADGLTPLDPDELAALLADLEAHGGMLDAADLALLDLEQPPSATPEPSAVRSASWTVAADVLPGAAPRFDGRLGGDSGILQFGLRWRGDAVDRQAAGWLQAGAGAWRVTGGAGSLAHGTGLVSAPLGARSSLSVDTSLLPAAAGWRPTLAVTMPQRLQGAACTAGAGPVRLDAGVAADQDGRPARHVRLEVGGAAASLGVLGRQREAGRAASVEGRWRGGPWRLAAEIGFWRLAPDQAAGQAWALAAAWRRDRWRAEFQAAGSRAAAGMPGAQRPASLPGWLGSGWAWRLGGRPAPGVRLGLLAAGGEDRDPRLATGRLRTRHTLAVSASGTLVERAGWELRWRRVEEAGRTWDAAQPWLPAAEDRRRLRTWWTLQVEHPAGGGTARVSWRLLEEAGQARNLFGVGWQRAGRRIRWRAGWQAAWGEPLDLVTVSVPVASFPRLRHWGRWDSAVLAGCEGRGRWSWQVGGELRRRSEEDGGGLAFEGRLLWGRAF